jgi:beta-glucosidase
MKHSPDTRAVASHTLSMSFSKSALFAVSLLCSSVAALPTANPIEVYGKLEKRASVFSPPYYPSPKGGWTPDWQASYAKAQNIVSQMTLVEKVNLTTGTGLYMVFKLLGAF